MVTVQLLSGETAYIATLRGKNGMIPGARLASVGLLTGDREPISGSALQLLGWESVSCSTGFYVEGGNDFAGGLSADEQLIGCRSHDARSGP